MRRQASSIHPPHEFRWALQKLICWVADHVWVEKEQGSYIIPQEQRSFANGAVSYTNRRDCLRCGRVEHWTRFEYSEWAK